MSAEENSEGSSQHDENETPSTQNDLSKCTSIWDWFTQEIGILRGESTSISPDTQANGAELHPSSAGPSLQLAAGAPRPQEASPDRQQYTDEAIAAATALRWSLANAYAWVSAVGVVALRGRTQPTRMDSGPPPASDCSSLSPVATLATHSVDWVNAGLLGPTAHSDVLNSDGPDYDLSSGVVSGVSSMGLSPIDSEVDSGAGSDMEGESETSPDTAVRPQTFSGFRFAPGGQLAMEARVGPSASSSPPPSVAGRREPPRGWTSEDGAVGGCGMSEVDAMAEAEAAAKRMEQDAQIAAMLAAEEEAAAAITASCKRPAGSGRTRCSLRYCILQGGSIRHAQGCSHESRPASRARSSDGLPSGHRPSSDSDSDYCAAKRKSGRKQGGKWLFKSTSSSEEGCLNATADATVGDADLAVSVGCVPLGAACHARCSGTCGGTCAGSNGGPSSSTTAGERVVGSRRRSPSAMKRNPTKKRGNKSDQASTAMAPLASVPDCESEPEEWRGPRAPFKVEYEFLRMFRASFPHFFDPMGVIIPHVPVVKKEKETESDEVIITDQQTTSDSDPVTQEEFAGFDSTSSDCRESIPPEDSIKSDEGPKSFSG